jgi:hypothetical protein
VRLRFVAPFSAAALLIAGLAAVPAVGTLAGRAPLDRARADWTAMSSTWPARQGVKVTDVVSFGKVAFAVGNSSKAGMHTPWVQVCKRRACVATRLPRPHGSSAVVTSIAGISRSDAWAVGWRSVGAANEHRPVFWRKAGPSWRVFDPGADFGVDITLTTVEVANKSKAFALGRYRHGDGRDAVTSTVYRWNGKGWKEIADLEHRADLPGRCAGWYQRDWVDVVARPGSAILVGRCGSRHRVSVLEQSDNGWRAVTGDGLPDGVAWRLGSLIGRQVWLIGAGSGGRRVIVANNGGVWKRVPVRGIRPAATVTDVAGVFATKVTAVGWIPTGGGHRVARAWRWGAGSWHETVVPAGISKSGLTAASVRGKGPVFATGQDLGRRPAKRAIIVHSVR